MKKLRLLLWEDCPKKCEGCCNKDWDLKSLPQVKDYSPYDKIMLTGGEPLMYPDKLYKIIKEIRKANIFANLIVYTSILESDIFFKVLDLVDGITVTIHTPSQVADLVSINLQLLKQDWMLTRKSLRINVFRGVEVGHINLRGWKGKANIEWIKNCPLPEGEVFYRY